MITVAWLLLTPARYLAADGKVCCPLRISDIWLHLHDMPANECASLAQAKAVDRILNWKPWSGPRITVRNREAGA